MHLIHRGIVNKKYKENLLNSFKQSFKKGFGIETDIHSTKDNKFVCYHDFTLTRIFKKKQSIKNLYYQQLKELSLKQNKHSKKQGKNHFNILKWSYHMGLCILESFGHKQLSKKSKYP